MSDTITGGHGGGLTAIDLASVATVFGDRLHRAGLATTPERSGRFAEIIDLTAPARLDELYWAARLAFVIDKGAVAMFDRVFAEVFRGTVDVADVSRNPVSYTHLTLPTKRIV